MHRCSWVEGKPDFYIAYHDQVWGNPCHNDHDLFKWLLLEMFHTGLSWQLVLSKEANFRQVFDNYDYQAISQYDVTKLEELCDNPKIIRNRRKIESAVLNAQAFLKVQADYGSFDRFIWSFSREKVVKRQTGTLVPKRTPLSDQVTQALKKYGFKQIGSVTIYSYLQAIGVVNDHDLACDFR